MKWLFFLLLLSTSFRLHAQDTVSAAGVDFKPVQPPATAVAPPSAGNVSAAGKANARMADRNGKAQPAGKKDPQSGWTLFLAGVAGGFAALLMPCIFPMLPMTVGFFTKDAGRAKGMRKALFYGLSIVVIYVTLGLSVTLLFGADALNGLSTNGVFNLFFFLVLVVFAASFLGGFEITLPSTWVNKADAAAGRQGLAGIFFLAATLTLVSFSCTGPIIGTLLVQTATTGALLGPAIGMLGFALALASPFTLFALFPGWLNKLPRSGGWLNSVKVVLGLLELALALKFLSNVDLAYHWHWFAREVFLALWILIFGIMGLYLLGKLRFRHDTPALFLSVPRAFLSIVVLAFTLYMVPGLWGAPLKAISAFLPPMSTQDFDLSASSPASNPKGSTTAHKYAALFDRPKGFDPYFDYDEALAFAGKAHKPLLIDFTGHACVNCRKMEANVWTDPAVEQLINSDYILVQLYVDDKTDLDTAEQVTTPEGRLLKTLGNKYSWLEISKFGANSQPFYVLLDPETEQPLLAPEGADFDPSAYLSYLDKGLTAFRRIASIRPRP